MLMQEDIDLIHRYLKGALTPEEHEAFLLRLDTDETLRQELALHSLAMEALRQDKAAELRRRFSNPEQEAVRQSLRYDFRGRRTILLAILAILAGAGLWFFNRNRVHIVPDNIKPSLPSSEQRPGSSPDSLPQVNGSKLPESAPDLEHNSAAYARLYANHFKVYQNTLGGGVRGEDSSAEASVLFFQRYDQGRYKQALEAFPTNADDDLNFYKANALLRADSTRQAIGVLQFVLKKGESQYLTQTRWYLALALLKAGMPEEALAHLKVLGGQKDGYKQEEARKLILEMERITAQR